MKKLTAIVISMILILSMMSGTVIAKNGKPQHNPNFSGKVDVGGFRLFINVQGNRQKDKPAVIFESGYGFDSTTWSAIQPVIASKTQTVSYDRSGLGQSDESGRPKVASEKAEQLHKLLKKAKIKPPYLIVAHSIGGSTARVFADKYPNEVAGVVFIDVSHDDQVQAVLASLPPDQVDAYKAQFTAEGSLDDIGTSLDQARATRVNDRLRYKPIRVISATVTGAGPEFDAIWQVWQKDIASLSKYSKQYIAEGATHFVHLEQPILITDTIKNLLKKL